VEADTDGVYFTPPPGHAPEDDARLLDAVAAGLPAGITLELDGRYPAMFSYKMKTYALLDERGRVTLKGSAFRSRGLEPFQRRLPTGWPWRAAGPSSPAIRSPITSPAARRAWPSTRPRSRRAHGTRRARTRTWSTTSRRCSRPGSASAASPSRTGSSLIWTRH